MPLPPDHPATKAAAILKIAVERHGSMEAVLAHVQAKIAGSQQTNQQEKPG